MSIPQKLKSRKFWITVLSFFLFILNEQYGEAAAVVMAYIGFEGGADIVSRLQTAPKKLGQLSSDNPFQGDGVVVPGEKDELTDQIVSGEELDALPLPEDKPVEPELPHTVPDETK